MTEPGGVLMGRADLERAFAALGDRLVRRGVVADIFVVGGAAMALAYDAKRVTRDVDATFVHMGSSSRSRERSPMSWACRRGGSTSRPVCTCPAATTRESVASLITPG